jgi:hypothetical protein
MLSSNPFRSATHPNAKNTRARAAIIFDEIAFRALEEFPTGPGLKAVRTPSTLMLYIGDSITLRFKKIRKNGRCSNILTKQQILFRLKCN